MKLPLTITDFWKIKRQIDDEVKRLGWSKDKCKSYIKTVYGRQSRLSMTDTELIDLLNTLKATTEIVRPTNLTSLKEKRSRRRHR